MQAQVKSLRDLGGRLREHDLDRLGVRGGEGTNDATRFALGPFHRLAQEIKRFLAGFPVSRIEIAGEVGQLLGKPIVQVAGDPPPLLQHRGFR